MIAYQLAARFVAKHAQHLATCVIVLAALAAANGAANGGFGGELACNSAGCSGSRVVESFGEVPCNNPGCGNNRVVPCDSPGCGTH